MDIVAAKDTIISKGVSEQLVNHPAFAIFLKLYGDELSRISKRGDEVEILNSMSTYAKEKDEDITLNVSYNNGGMNFYKENFHHDYYNQIQYKWGIRTSVTLDGII